MISPTLVHTCVWLVAGSIIEAVPAAVATKKPSLPAKNDTEWYCSSDLECNLNGSCLLGNNSNHQCLCDQGWTGVNCSRLDLVPTESGSGYRPVDRSSWGASVLYDNDVDGQHGQYYMIAAEMVERCGLTSWRTNSKTILATSSDLFGSYNYHSTLVGVWTHNPVVVRLPPTDTETENNNGSFLLYAAGYGDGKSSIPLPCYPSGCCVNGTSPCGVHAMHGCNSTGPPWPHPPPPSSDDDWRDPDQSYRNISLWHADRLAGPWRKHWATFEPGNVTSHQYTPAAWSFPNGTVVLLLAGGGLFRAATWKGPYQYWGAGKNLYWGCGGEDPFLYVDARGHWHCLFHAAPYSDLTNAGGHAYSVDGTTWYTTPNAVYRGDYIVEIHNTTNHNNGTEQQPQQQRKLILGKRERPHLVFGDDEEQRPRNILALVTGVCVSPDDTLANERRWALCNNNPWPGYYDKTFTHVQRVRQKHHQQQPSDDNALAIS
jgi:hypothetical protein